MVESTALEMRRALTGTVGSNPTLSAKQLSCSYRCLILPAYYGNNTPFFWSIWDPEMAGTGACQGAIQRFSPEADSVVPVLKT